ncbi:MAG: hypothetical protein UX68_C0041G0006 [Parcubacteria group bacterium GW2011_GWA2_46_9]|uniref:Protein NO VEIN C-terminal domain-containing protein n=1 Tax=Candidatus Buchananbacteria bacterium RIFCSPHIGHO2_02_FULL_56_16 TaxID=1797542 RepID=A0A1G1YFV2_9BACT|nr:MAG: hypothetical protein UX68_C0041G0006 [Parcubacteria group bacterium GW2011_GWA2_46_9]OGY51233.1 MAG: hypothetical protein A3J59_02635 [Candidatus Buchananbacteria bacterium RIFCSPHIGHO2_02_FULL_56_16]
MPETALQELRPEEYKHEISVYQNYRDGLNNLEKAKELLRPYYLFCFGLYFFVTILISTILGWDFWPNIIIYAYISLIISVFSHESDFLTNIFSFGKFNKLKGQIKYIEELKRNSYSKLEPFEKIIHDYYQTQLKNFFEKNLYRKRSGNHQFDESLSEFASMIKEVSTVNLITTHLPLGEYEDYLMRRTIDHAFKTSEKTENLASIRNFVKNLSSPKEQRLNEIIAPEKLYRTARKIDNWDEINKRRNTTGQKGEEIAVVIEQEFLESIGRKDLAKKVRHVSTEDGDGLGYDVLSFFENGKEKYIEVKSTTSSLQSPFFLSRNELGFLEEHNEDAFIYRIFVSDDEPQMRTDSSPEIFEQNEIIPIQYIVKAK